MKKMVFWLLAVGSMAVASCSRNGCYPSRGSRDWAGRWQVKRIEHTGPGYLVKVKRNVVGVGEVREIFYQDCLPDTVAVGKYITL